MDQLRMSMKGGYSGFRKLQLEPLLATLLEDPLLADFSNRKPTLKEIETLVGVEKGSAMMLCIRKFDDTSFDVAVLNNASVRDLRSAVQKKVNEMEEGQMGHRHISWKHVWGNFCLMHNNEKLLKDSSLLSEFGVKNGDEWCQCSSSSRITWHPGRLVITHDQRSDGDSCWPSLRSRLLLRSGFWSMIFPPSDFRHPVMTPAVLLMVEYLMRCQATSARDNLVGSFLCTLLSVLRKAQRFCPEVFTFILALLASALPTDATQQVQSLCPAFMVDLVASNPWLQLKSKGAVTMGSFDLDFFALMTFEEDHI